MQFTDEANAAWMRIIDSDRLLARAVDHLLDRVEQDPRCGRHRPPYWFLTVRVPGRDQLYVVTWIIEEQGAVIAYIGTAPASV